MYHYTRDLKHSRYPKIKGLDVELFRKQIYFLKEKFTVVTMEEVIDAAERKNKLPPDAVLLTFDDGYIDNYTYAFPILEEANVQGSFFVPAKTFTTRQLLDVNKIHYILASANVNDLLIDVFEQLNYYRGVEFDYPLNEDLFSIYAETSRFDTKEIIFLKRILQDVLPEKLRNCICSSLFQKYVGVTEEQLAHELYMTREQIKVLKQHGMFIGIHGYDHYWLGNLSIGQMKTDISNALKVMDEFIDNKRWVMNYPYGSFNEDVVQYIAEQGACIGLTTEVAVADLTKHEHLKLPRLDCNDFPPKSENYKKEWVL